MQEVIYRAEKTEKVRNYGKIEIVDRLRAEREKKK